MEILFGTTAALLEDVQITAARIITGIRVTLH